MEVTKAEIDAVLDAHGRFVWTPHALTLDGQQNVPCDLQDGESLLSFLRRHVPSIESGAWSVSIGGAVVPRAMWAKTFPKHGMHIACRASVGKQVVALVAVAVLSYFTMGMGGMAAGSFMGMSGAVGYAAAIGVFVAGSVLINKVLGPKVPKPGEGPAAAKQVYSLSSRRNASRPYEPVPVLWGEMRVTPDLAANPYAFFVGDDQYLVTQLLGGVNVHSAVDLSVGDTPLSSYQDFETYFDGFAGMPQQTPPLYSNADSIPGAELVNKEDGSAGWVERTTSEGTVRVEVDIEGTLFSMSESGSAEVNQVTLDVEIKYAGAQSWSSVHSGTIASASQDVIRRTLGFDVPKGQHSVRVRSSNASSHHATRASVSLVWATLRSVQEDDTDYSQFGRIALKIKATGQLSGSLDTLRVTYLAKPMPVWTGAAWATATTRANGLSNPGAILLQTLRGIWHEGKLQFGFGLSDEQIDIDGLKAFMLHCAARGYTYDKWITSSVSLQDFCQEVALTGMGEFSWTDGSRPTAVFVSSGQPVSGVVNMANMLKASFSVDYSLSNAADGIEYQYVDRDKNFETVTLRVAAPGVTTPLNPARITGDGVTTETHAAAMARYHLAQSLYQYKTIGYGADIEHLDYRRLSVLSISHDLTQWGYGGRVLSARYFGETLQIQLDEVVPPLTNPHLGLRLPGDRDYRVWPVLPLTQASDTLTLIGSWPDGVALPGEGDNAMDTLWCYDFKATPGYRVRVTGIEPEGELKGAKVTCVPEGPEFWDYVLNGTYVPAPAQSALPQHGRPEVRNLRVTEHVHTQGDTEWFELEAVWDVLGDCDHAQVWAGRDGSELRLVDGNAMGGRAKFRIDTAGQWLIDVRPFSSQGKVGLSAQVLYITTRTDVAPRNVDEFSVHDLSGGLRRFVWRYVGDKPAAFAGVQIRYVPGDVSLSVAQWESMTPLGQADDIYKAAFETTRPEAGLWTFGIRAINTAGQLSEGIRRFAIDLEDGFEQVQQPDLTPPPAPTGVLATGLFAGVQVVWSAPTYTVGHGHARTEVWVSEIADFAESIKAAEGYAGPVSFEWALGSTVYVRARHVTIDGIAGPWSGVASAQTAQDVGQLLDVLDGQITSSQLHQDLSEPIAQIDRIDFDRIELLNEVPMPALQELQQVDLTRIAQIDRIDKAGGPLGKSLLDAAASLETAQQQSRQSMDQMAEELLKMVLTADETLERITDAGIVVDPLTGQVRQYALEATQEHVTALEVLLDAVAGQLALKATTAYVDGKIAEAVLSPADLLLYEGLDARLIQVTQTLDSINGTLTQKANALELQDAVVRLSTAENTLDALSGQIALRVTRAEYEADQGALQQRISSAELTLNALDVPSIQATVQAASSVIKDAEKQAEALLQDILTGERNRVQAQEALAFARTELSASIEEGLAAEAQQRTQLAVQLGQSLAAVQQELTTLAAADVAEAQARLALAAQLQQGLQTLTAALETEQRVRADADAAEVLARQALKTQLESVDNALLAGIEEEESARVTADQAEAQARQQLAARLDGKDGELQAAIVAEQSARARGDAAEATQRQQLAATVAANRTEGLNAVDAAFGAVATEQAARATADAALAQRVDQVQAGVAGNAAGIQAEQTARANADSALGQRIDTVQAAVGSNTAAIQAEQQARSDALGAEAKRTDVLLAASQKLAADDAEKQAEALLQDILAGEQGRERASQALAFARTELAASIQEGLQAEAQQRTQLAVQFGQSLADVQQQMTVLSAADAAQAQTSMRLAAQIEQGLRTVESQIQTESQARSDADAAQAYQRTQLQAEVSANRSEAMGGIDAAFARLATEESVRASETGHLAAQYTARMQLMSNGQWVAGGWGMSGTAGGAAGPTIDFGVLANRFFIAAPEGSGIESDFRLTVQTTPTTENGVAIPVGLYVNSAYITNVSALWGRFGTLVADTVQTINLSASQITTGYLDADRIAVRSITMDKLKAGEIAAEGLITVGGEGAQAPLVLSPEGEVISNGNGQRARLWSGNVELYKSVPGIGMVMYTALSRVETGVAQNGALVTIPGYFKEQPSVIVSPRDLTLYKASYAGQDQSIQCEATGLAETTAGSMVWQFTPRATLSLAANTGTQVINQSGSSSGAWTSSTYTTASNTRSITANVTMGSMRGNGASQFYRRSVRCRVEYLQGGSWVSGAWQTRALADSTAASVSVSVSQTFPSSGSWQFRIYAEAFDTDGGLFGSVAYEYASGVLTGANLFMTTANASGNTVTASSTLSGYSVPAGYSVYEATYSGRLEVGQTSVAHTLSIPAGQIRSAPSGNWTEQVTWSRTSGSLNSPLVFTLRMTGTAGIVNMNIDQIRVEVKSRRLTPNSTTAANNFAFTAYSYELTTAQVLASGSINWVAIGD